jgi:hypothetical protein
MSDWATAGRVLQTIQAGDDAAWTQGENRRKINDQVNGKPPFDDKTAKELNVKINVNWGEIITPLAHARRSYEDAVLGQERFFKVTLPLAPEQQKISWELEITNGINDILKEDEDLAPDYETQKQYEISALVCHGLGPMLFDRDDDVTPRFVALEDIRIPTDTTTDFKNLEWFAVRHLYTPGELVKKVWGKNTIPGWNKKAIIEVLKNYKSLNYGEVTYTWETAPEKMAELVKQNMGFYSGDAMPTASLWHFYFKDQDGGDDWFMSVILDTTTQGQSNSTEFLFQSDKPVAAKLSRLMQCQFGDLNNKAPFLVHSTRSLGFMLMEPCFWSNLTRCRLLQHVHENMNVWLRITDPAGKARAQMVQMFDKATLPEGVSIIPQAERHQIDANLVESTLAQLRQLQNEASATYTHELDTGTQKEQTATETMANLQRVNAMMSGLLGRFFRREKFMDREICRRFCLKNTTNEKAKAFQDRCRKAGIPDAFMDVELWKIEPERQMGNGNPTMALMAAEKMMQVRPMLGPDAQMEVLHDAVAVYLNDPRKASRLVPIEGKQGMTTGQEFGQAVFGSLMAEGMVQPKEGLSPIDQIQTLMALLAGKCAAIQKRGAMADSMGEIAGLMNVSKFIAGLIAQLEQDPSQKQLVKQFSDDLGKLDNEIKAFAQRLSQKNAQGQEGDNGNGQAMKDAMALRGKMAMDAAKLKQTELTKAQARRHKEVAFQGEQKRKDVSTLAEVNRAALRTAVELDGQKAKMRSVQE